MANQADREGVQQLIGLFMCAECMDEHGSNPQSVSCYCDCHSSSRDEARWPSMREAVRAALQGSVASPQELDRLRAIVEWQGDELSKRMACVECGLEPHPDSELYNTVCASCRRCFSCAEPMCPTCGDATGTKQRAIDLLKENAKLRAAGSGATTPAPQWEPIETAPKDGTYVLLYGPPRPPRHPNYVLAIGAFCDTDFGRSFWAQQWRGWPDQELPPTHWMSFPNPPSAGSGAAERTQEGENV